MQKADSTQPIPAYPLGQSSPSSPRPTPGSRFVYVYKYRKKRHHFPFASTNCRSREEVLGRLVHDAGYPLDGLVGGGPVPRIDKVADARKEGDGGYSVWANDRPLCRAVDDVLKLSAVNDLFCDEMVGQSLTKR